MEFLNQNKMEQTAVEWLKEMLIDNKYLLKDAEHLFEHAKEMEEQQKKDAYLEGIKNYDPTFKSE